MVTRVATSSQNLASVRNLQEANRGMALSSYQITTGLKSRTLSEDAGNSYKLLTLRDVQTRTNTYMSNLGNVNNQLKATENAMQQMTDILAEATALATTGRNENSAETRASLAPKAQALAEGFYNLLNSQYNGMFLFSGSNAHTSPISGSASPTAFPGEPISTAWYQGDHQLATTVNGAHSTLEYGVLGDNEAFNKMKAGLEGLWYGLQNNNVTEIDTAIATLNNAKSLLSTAVSNVGGQMNNVAQFTERYTNQQTFIQDTIDSVEKVDISEALTTFSQQTSTLQASMMIISQISQITLMDYIR